MEATTKVLASSVGLLLVLFLVGAAQFSVLSGGAQVQACGAVKPDVLEALGSETEVSVIISLGAPAAPLAAAAGVIALGQQPDWFNGDANCDGRIDSLDALAVLQFEAGLLDALVFPDGGDPNEDGNVNSVDVLLILQFDAGLIPDRTPNSCISIPPGPGPS